MNFRQFTKTYAFPLWRWYLAGFSVLAISNIIMLKIPQLAKGVINHLAEASSDSQLGNLALYIMGLGFLQIVVRALSRLFIFWPGRHIESESKIEVFSRILQLTQTYLEKSGLGDFVSRLSNDITHLRVFYAFGILQFANLIFLTVFSIAQMLRTNVSLTLLALIPMSMMLLITRFAMPKLQNFTRLNQEAQGRLTSRITEALANVHVLQANNVVANFVERAEVENEVVYQTNIRTVFVRTVVFPMMAFLSGLSQSIILLYGGYEAIQGRLSVGDILAFNVYIGLLTFPLMAVGIVLSTYQRARTSIERLDEVERAPKEDIVLKENAPESASVIPIVKAGLQIRNLTFSFEGSTQKKPTLENISFEVKPGEHLGIYGPIGSGKTTLFNLMTRIYEPPTGTIFINGEDICRTPLNLLRSRVGYAEQSVHLFSESIRNNMLFGSQGISEARITESARKAEILPDILSFPNQWETEIGERGIKLSGGQKQRLALARILARDFSLLILDDVLSAVDHETETKLIKTLRDISMTCLIASHRPSVLAVCDRVLLLRDGVIEKQGRFEDVKDLIFAHEREEPAGEEKRLS